jgi:hypothetical protein
MATSTAKSVTPVTEDEFGMEVETSLSGLPLRGRSRDELVPKIREQLEACLVDNSIRSFKGIVDNKAREAKARKIRQAATMITETHPNEIPVVTRYDEPNHKLYFGPESVMKELSGK